MSIDLSKSTEKISKNEITDMAARVNKFIEQGGVISDDRRIYVDMGTQREYVIYSQFQNILNRWKYQNEPDTIQIYVEPVCVDNDDKILPISTILDMEIRVNQYLTNGGNIEDSRRIYLNMGEMYEYITYKKYEEVMGRVDAFRTSNGRNPNWVYLRVVSNENSTTRVDAVGDDITPNGDGWYISPRYSTNKNIMKQDTNYYCGPNSVQLVWYELTGELISESVIAKYAGTTTNGTGHDGLEKAIKQLAKNKGISVNVNWDYLGELGYEKLGKLVKDGKTGVFIHNKYKNKYGHYEYIIGVNIKTQKLMVNNSLSGGWIEYRSFSTMSSYVNGISQKSVCSVSL